MGSVVTDKIQIRTVSSEITTTKLLHQFPETGNATPSGPERKENGIWVSAGMERREIWHLEVHAHGRSTNVIK